VHTTTSSRRIQGLADLNLGVNESEDRVFGTGVSYLQTAAFQETDTDKIQWVREKHLLPYCKEL
jgi:hypothetical protein